MPVSSLPINMSEINAEFGTKSLAAHFAAGDGGVGSLPGNMSEFAGLSDSLHLTSVDVDDINQNDETPDSASTVEGFTVADTTPTDDGSVTYVWTKVSGATITNVQGGSQKIRVFSAFLGNSEINAVYRCRASNINGSVAHDFVVHLSHTQSGA